MVNGEYILQEKILSELVDLEIAATTTPSIGASVLNTASTTAILQTEGNNNILHAGKYTLASHLNKGTRKTAHLHPHIKKMNCGKYR